MPKAYLLAIELANFGKSMVALSFALSEMTRIMENGMLYSKQTCATAAPSISTQTSQPQLF